MSYRIIGLRYVPPVQKVETEEQLLQVFADLKETCFKLCQTFKMTCLNGDKISDFEQFLKIAIGQPNTLSSTVILNGSGDVGGLVVKDTSVEYNLSLVSAAVQYWDQYRDSSCTSCNNHYWDQVRGEMEHACAANKKMWAQGCPNYDAYRKNAKGGPARKLDELIKEALA